MGFLAVFAALIAATLFAPLLGVPFGAKVGLLGGLIAPLGNVKIDILNTILSPFNLVLANFPVGGTAAAGPLVVAGTNGRSLASGFSANPETIDMVTYALQHHQEKTKSIRDSTTIPAEEKPKDTEVPDKGAN